MIKLIINVINTVEVKNLIKFEEISLSHNFILAL